MADRVLCMPAIVQGRTDIGMSVYNGGIRAYISFLVDTVKARGGTTSQGNRTGAVIRCLALRRQVVTKA